jgi:hypothetical protein
VVAFSQQNLGAASPARLCETFPTSPGSGEWRAHGRPVKTFQTAPVSPQVCFDTMSAFSAASLTTRESSSQPTQTGWCAQCANTCPLEGGVRKSRRGPCDISTSYAKLGDFIRRISIMGHPRCQIRFELTALHVMPIFLPNATMKALPEPWGSPWVPRIFCPAMRPKKEVTYAVVGEVAPTGQSGTHLSGILTRT